MFEGAAAFNQDLSGTYPWKVDKVTKFTNMFKNAASFNQDISGWYVAAGTNFASMFEGAAEFNRGLSDWTVTGMDSDGAVTDMFKNAAKFKQNLCNWDFVLTDTATTQTGMFTGTNCPEPNADFTADTNIVNGDICCDCSADADTTGCEEVTACAVSGTQYSTASALRTAVEAWANGDGSDINTFDTTGLQSLDDAGTGVLEGIIAKGSFEVFCWDVSAVTAFTDAFRDNTVFNGFLGSWNVAAGTDFSGMFRGATAFNKDVSGWTVTAGTNFESMFEGAVNFNKDLSAWRPAATLLTTGLDSMFFGATVFDQNLCLWNSVEFAPDANGGTFSFGADTFTNTACNPATLTGFTNTNNPIVGTACANCDGS